MSHEVEYCQVCGKTTCTIDEKCCNVACDFCGPRNGVCSALACLSGGAPGIGGGPSTGDMPATGGSSATGGIIIISSGGSSGEVCGKTICAVNERCCNASCDLCGPRNGLCSALACVSSGAAGIGGGSSTGGTVATTMDPCGGCASDEICIYQIGGPGSSHYTCATQAPCGSASPCACIQNQGTCDIVASGTDIKVQCECQNNLL